MNGGLLGRLKAWGERLAPRTYPWVRTHWRRWREARFARRLARITRSLVSRVGMTVQSGPFTGMVYAPQAVSSALTPKLVGSYEAELHGAVAEAVTRGYTAVIDIGCAEGYYAVGLALRLLGAHVYAFDSDPVGRRLCAAMAEANGVAGRLTLLETCTVEALATMPLAGALLVCDCEGAELDLLRPDLLPGLAACDLLVELHDCFNPAISPTITARFAASHDIRLYDSVARDPAAYPLVSYLSPADQLLALDELRLPTRWAFMVARRIPDGI